MNYNNFVCRLAAPRPANPVVDKAPAIPKKPRKPGRRRLAASLAATIVLLGISSGETRAQVEEGVRVVPAPGTVLFAAGASGADLVEVAEEETSLSFPETLAGHMESVAAEVVSAAQPARAHASVLTVILICSGLGVACFQTARLVRCDSPC